MGNLSYFLIEVELINIFEMGFFGICPEPADSISVIILGTGL